MEIGIITTIYSIKALLQNGISLILGTLSMRKKRTLIAISMERKQANYSTTLITFYLRVSGFTLVRISLQKIRTMGKLDISM